MPKNTRKKSTTSRTELVAAFEKKEPLTWSDVKCQICFGIFVEPVTFPCKHSVCLHCFNKFIRETSLLCPCCRLRLSVWSRTAIKEKKLVNEPFSKRVKTEFPKEFAKRLKELDEENDDDSEEPKNGLTIKDDSGFTEFDDDDDENSQNDCPKVRDGEFAPPGELAKELTQIYSKHQMELDQERRRREEEEEQASQMLIEEILRNEERETSSQLELDLRMAQMLAEQENEGILPKSDPMTQQQRQSIDSPVRQSQVMKPVPKSKLNGKASTNMLKGVSKGSKRRQSYTNTSSSTATTSSNKSKRACIRGSNVDKSQMKIGNYFSPATSTTSSPSVQLTQVSQRSNSRMSWNDSLDTQSNFGFSNEEENSATDDDVPGPSTWSRRKLAESLNKTITSTRVETVTIPSSPDDVVIIDSRKISPRKGSNPRNDDNNNNVCLSPSVLQMSQITLNSQSSSWSLSAEIPGGSLSSDNQSQNLPEDQSELYRMEEEALKKYRLKMFQEEKDRLLAEQIQKELSGESVREFRGRDGDGRYSIRNWTKSTNK